MSNILERTLDKIAPKSERKKREEAMIKEFGLKKDPGVKNKYWIDNTRYILINMTDQVSVDSARAVLKQMYANPEIVQATPEELAKHATAPKGGAFGEVSKVLNEVAREIEPYAKTANKQGADFFFGDMPKTNYQKASKELYNSDGLDQFPDPKRSMRDLLDTSAAEDLIGLPKKSQKKK